MKKIFFVLTLTLSLCSYANIETEDLAPVNATDQEIQTARACFEETEKHGCRHPREDLKQFRTCMSDVYPNLSSGCKKMMKELYGK